MREDTDAAPSGVDNTQGEIVYPSAYREAQRGLSQLHHMTGILPSVKVLNGMVRKLDQIPVAGGIYSDVYLGYWLEDQKAITTTLVTSS